MAKTARKVEGPVVRILSYLAASAGSKELAEKMGIKRIRQEGSKFVGGPGKIVINWGNSRIPDYIDKDGTRIINSPRSVAIASNKATFFQLVGPVVRVPPYTSSRGVVQQWVDEGHTVVARTVLNGSSGRGIVLIEPGVPENQDTNAPLYTKYIKKRDEFRLHVFKKPNGEIEVFDVQRKGLRGDVNREEANWKIRNLANGFIFARNEGYPVPDDVKLQATRALQATELDFGAVDVIWNEKEQKAYVLEINTAPGLVGSTVESYVNMFKTLIGE